MKRASPATGSSASSTSSDERRRESACRSLVADSPPPRPKRERSLRGSKPPRAPSPATRTSLPSSPALAVRGKVARLLDSYLDRTIGAGADEDDDDDADDAARPPPSVASTEPEPEGDATEEGFRLFADSKPGVVRVHGDGTGSKKRRVEEKKKEDSDTDSEEEKEHVKRLQSVVVDIKPPQET